MLLLLAACEVPLDLSAEAPENVLTGEVLFAGEEDVRNVFLLLYDPLDPPPPVGTGAPLDFASVPAEEFSATDLPSAPWYFPGVPDGSYLLTALMDMDGDFQPLLSSNAGATCGDYIGAHLADLSTGEIGIVTVEGGVRQDGISVIIASRLTTERPAFVFATPPVVEQASAETQTFTMLSSPIYSEILNNPGPWSTATPCGNSFFVYVEDLDGDGAPDPHWNESYAAQGAYAIWPRVYLKLLAGADGTTPEAGESWAGEAVVYPDFLLSGEVPVGVPTPRDNLTAVYIPAAIHTLADGTEETVTAPNLPTGSWSVTLVSFTGQTWTLPNPIASFPATAPSYDPLEQAGFLTVQ